MVKIVEAELKIEVNDDIKAASIAANIAPLRTKTCKKCIIDTSSHYIRIRIFYKVGKPIKKTYTG